MSAKTTDAVKYLALFKNNLEVTEVQEHDSIAIIA